MTCSKLTMMLLGAFFLVTKGVTGSLREATCSIDENGVEQCVAEDSSLNRSTSAKRPIASHITDFGVDQAVSGSTEEAFKTEAVIEQTLVYMASLSKEERFSCGTNTHELCSFWAGQGECQNNPTFMLQGCAPACNSCSGTVSPNFDAAQESTLQKINIQAFEFGKLQKTENHFKAQTQKIIDGTSEYMATIENPDACKNDHELCSFWAAQGECEKNQSYMKTNCAPACRSCDLIDFSVRCPYIGDEKNPPIYQRGDMHAMFLDIANGKWDQFEPSVRARPNINLHDTARDAIDVLVGDDIPWVVTFENFLTDEECDRLITLGYQEGYERSKDVGGKKEDGSFDGVESINRTSENAWCSKESCLSDPLTKTISKRIAEVTGIPEQNSEYFQILRYEEDQFYNLHHDYIPHQVNRNSGPRVLTFFLYLSDVTEGGGTHFHDLDITVDPKKGKALLWPSVLSNNPYAGDKMTRHQALPVLEGTKYAANAWLHLKDYRAAHELGCA